MVSNYRSRIHQAPAPFEIAPLTGRTEGSRPNGFNEWVIMRHRLILTTLCTVFLLVLAACGDVASDDDAAVAEFTDDTSEPGAPTPVAASERPSITIAEAFLMNSLDPGAGWDAYHLIQRGAAETLTRVGHDQSVEPWLAESVELLDGATWKIVLREDVTFWDGDVLTAEHVVDAIERNWEELPAAAGFLPEETELVIIDDQTIELTLPEPNSGLPHNLSASQLVIHKLEGDDAIMTGPYQPVTFHAGTELVLEAYEDYWNDSPLFAGITIKLMPDGNARNLAVQAGDVDMITGASPENAAAASDDVASHSVESTRVHYLMLNHAQAPFDDPAVREALNLAVDRDELNEVALGGLGLPVTTIIPHGIGIDTPEQLSLDVEQAEQILDGAGWEMNDDGTRAKNGETLEFLLYSYPSRPELTPIVVSIQDQLSRIGIDVSVQEVDDIAGAIAGTEFQASIYSINMLPTGDVYYALQLAASSDGPENHGNYSNDQLDDLLRQAQITDSEEDRAALLLEAQQILQDDHAMVFLMAAPRAVVYRPDSLEEPALHPSDMYFIHTDSPVPAS